MSTTSDVILIIYSPWCISLRDTFVKELSHSVNTVAKSAVFTRRIVSTVPIRFLCRGSMCVEASSPGSVSVRSVLPSCFRPGRCFVSHTRFHARKLRRDYVFVAMCRGKRLGRASAGDAIEDVVFVDARSLLHDSKEHLLLCRAGDCGRLTDVKYAIGQMVQLPDKNS